MNPVDLARQAIVDHHAIQKGGELAGFLALLMDMDPPPRVIVEIGSDAGGTLWAFRQLGARVVGVTLPGNGLYGSGRALDDHGCEIVYGDSHSQETVDRLASLLGGEPVDVLFIDGDHRYGGVASDFRLFSPLVRPGGIVAFHDICDHPTIPEVKVKAFWDQLTEEIDDWEEIVTDPPTWAGIGVVWMHEPELV